MVTRKFPLAVGQRVYDCEAYRWGKIIALNHQMVTISNGRRSWKTYRSNAYQLAKGIVSVRDGKAVCWEHNISDYPFYSPSLDENLFGIECDTK